MNEKRRKLILAAGVAAIPLSSGCLTASVWGTSGASKTTSYQETVSSVLMSADGKTLAVIGKDYHYLFAATEPIKAILTPTLGEVVDVRLLGFAVDGDQKITGNYVLSIKPGSSDAVREQALAVGFKAVGKEGGLRLEGQMTGTRYRSNGIQPGAASQQLRKTYSVTVSEPASAVSQVGSGVAKVLVTPITLVADGVLILFAVPLLLVAGVASH